MKSRPFARNSLTLVIALLLAAVPLSAQGEEEETPTEVEVQTAKVIRTTLHRRIRVYGYIQPEPAGDGHPAALARLAPALPGLVTEANAAVGQKVAKGEVLFQLDSRAAKAAADKATMAEEIASKNAERQRVLIKGEGTSEKLLLAAEQALAEARAELATAKVNLSLLRGVAPFSGTLMKYSARPGEAADATTVLAEIVDLDRLVAEVRIPRADAAELRLGQEAGLRASDTDSAAATTVSFVGPQVDPVTDTVLARLKLPKKSGLRPGQFITARIVVEEKPNLLAVPREAVYTNPDGHSTLSIVTKGVATKISIKVGLRDGDLVEVAGDGLSEGTTVVTVGSYALPEKTKVVPPAP